LTQRFSNNQNSLVVVTSIHSGRIVDWFGGIPKCHDKKILSMSKLLDKIEQWELGIGDKGYEGESRIITPFKGDYLTQQQRRFNKIVRIRRQIIERVNSRLKDFEILHSRFRHNYWLQPLVFNVCINPTNLKLQFHPL
jgi:hypothetical protein